MKSIFVSDFEVDLSLFVVIISSECISHAEALGMCWDFGNDSKKEYNFLLKLCKSGVQAVGGWVVGCVLAVSAAAPAATALINRPNQQAELR